MTDRAIPTPTVAGRRRLPGGVFDEISKGTLAVLAWHLANCISGEADADGAAEAAIHAELTALERAGILRTGQAAAFARAMEVAVASCRSWGAEPGPAYVSALERIKAAREEADQ